MKIAVFGSSNEIGPSSYIHFLSLMNGLKVTNISLGASTSSAGLYSALNLDADDYEFGLISYEINDLGAVAEKILDIDAVKNILTTLIYALRAKKCHPILCIVPSRQTINSMSLVEAAYIEVCEREKVNYFNVAAMVRELKTRGFDYLKVMRDPYHMGADLARLAAAALASGLTAMTGRTRSTSTVQKNMSALRLVRSSAFAASHRIETRGTSLRSADYVQIAPGHTLVVPVKPGEILQALVVNGGAPGANVEFKSGEDTVVKTLSYRDPNRPAWNFTIVADIRGPMRGSDGGIAVKLKPRESEATEPTLHARGFSGDDYGLIEVEAFLVSSARTVPTEVSVTEYEGPPSIVPEEALASFLADAAKLF